MNVLCSLRWLGLAGLVVVGALSGCGKPSGPAMIPVSGSVTVDNLPLNAGQVTFHPVTKDSTGTTGFSGGTIDSTGKYTVFTGGQTGAPLGKYKVTVNPSMVPIAGGAPPVAFNKRFQDAKTGLDVEVVASPSAGAYDLKLTKK